MTNPVGTNRKREWCVVVVVSRVTGSLSQRLDITSSHISNERMCVLSCFAMLCCACVQSEKPPDTDPVLVTFRCKTAMNCCCC